MNTIRQLVVRVSDELHTKLKVKVAQDNTSLQKVIEDYLIRYSKGYDISFMAPSSINEFFSKLTKMLEEIDVLKNEVERLKSDKNEKE